MNFFLVTFIISLAVLQSAFARQLRSESVASYIKTKHIDNLRRIVGAEVRDVLPYYANGRSYFAADKPKVEVSASVIEARKAKFDKDTEPLRKAAESRRASSGGMKTAGIQIEMEGWAFNATKAGPDCQTGSARSYSGRPLTCMGQGYYDGDNNFIEYSYSKSCIRDRKANTVQTMFGNWNNNRNCGHHPATPLSPESWDPPSNRYDEMPVPTCGFDAEKGLGYWSSCGDKAGVLTQSFNGGGFVNSAVIKMYRSWTQSLLCMESDFTSIDNFYAMPFGSCIDSTDPVTGEKSSVKLTSCGKNNNIPWLYFNAFNYHHCKPKNFAESFDSSFDEVFQLGTECFIDMSKEQYWMQSQHHYECHRPFPMPN